MDIVAGAEAPQEIKVKTENERSNDIYSETELSEDIFSSTPTADTKEEKIAQKKNVLKKLASGGDFGAEAAQEGGELSDEEKPVKVKWNKKRVKTFKLEEWKDGKKLNTIPMGKKSKYFFGRAKTADYPLLHPSSSRMHAFIVHGCPGTTPPIDIEKVEGNCLTLIDMKTTSGTYYSARYPCKGRYKQKVPSGNGVLLREGMCIRFGHSTRNFICRGIIKDARLTVTQAVDLDDKAKLLNTRTKAKSVHVNTSKNPFHQHNEVESRRLALPKLAENTKKREFSGEGTTFSFHDAKKLKMKQIVDRSKANHQKALEIKRNDQGSMLFSGV